LGFGCGIRVVRFVRIGFSVVWKEGDGISDPERSRSLRALPVPWLSQQMGGRIYLGCL
jgi:hypothetical protein